MREGEGGRGGGKVCVVWCLDDKYRWYLYQLHCWLQCSSAHVPRFTLINDIKCWRNLNYTFRNIYFGRQEAGYWEKSLELWLVRYYATLHLTLHLTYRQLSLTMMMTASLEISALIAGLQVRRGWCQPGRLCTVNHWEPLSHPLIFNILSTWEEGGGRREGQLELRRRLQFLHFIPITKHYYQRSWAAWPSWGWIDANIMIVFTPIKIPNNLTLIIYIIRSQVSQPGSHRGGRRGIFKFSLFLQNISGWDWVETEPELLALW